MSFYSTLQIQHVDDPVDIGTKSAQILKILQDDGIHENVLSDLKDAFESGAGEFAVDAVYLLGLIETVATLFPDFPFHARGFGEEYRTTWVREFENGIATFSEGPWDY
jgi:hypothetical protein